MRRKRRYDGDEAELDLTPMLDVVFIMLIFFIVTATFVKESGIDLSTPDTQDQPKKSKKNILIVISNLGEVWINKRKIDIRAVRANVERLHAEMPEGNVVIKADKKAKTGIVVTVMDQVRLAGIYNLSLAAEETQ